MLTVCSPSGFAFFSIKNFYTVQQNSSQEANQFADICGADRCVTHDFKPFKTTFGSIHQSVTSRLSTDYLASEIAIFEVGLWYYNSFT